MTASSLPRLSAITKTTPLSEALETFSLTVFCNQTVLQAPPRFTTHSSSLRQPFDRYDSSRQTKYTQFYFPLAEVQKTLLYLGKDCLLPWGDFHGWHRLVSLSLTVACMHVHGGYFSSLMFNLTLYFQYVA